jgi:hypothetical protein
MEGEVEREKERKGKGKQWRGRRRGRNVAPPLGTEETRATGDGERPRERTGSRACVFSFLFSFLFFRTAPTQLCAEMESVEVGPRDDVDGTTLREAA